MGYSIALFFFGFFYTLGPKNDYYLYTIDNWFFVLVVISFMITAEATQFLLFWNVAFSYW